MGRGETNIQSMTYLKKKDYLLEIYAEILTGENCDNFLEEFSGGKQHR